MSKFLKLILCLLPLFFLMTHCIFMNDKKFPKAIKGRLDLSKWELSSEKGSVNLDGDWEFYWNEFLEPKLPIEKKLNHLSTPNNFINVPSSWHHFGYPLHGFGSYRLIIDLPKLENKIPLSIAISDLASSYNVFLNGKLIFSNGKVGKSKEESFPILRHKLIQLPLNEDYPSGNNATISNPKQIEIIIHVSNFRHIKSGIWNSMKFGSKQELESISKSKFVLDIMIFSILFSMGLYHLGLNFYRRADMSTFYFGIFCILFAFRVISINERIILDAIPSLPFLYIHKLGFFSFYFGSYIFLQFIRSLFPEEFSLKWSIFFAITLIPISCVVIFFPLEIYMRTIPLIRIVILTAILYCFKTLIFAIGKKRIGSRLTFFGFLILGGAAINDLLKSYEIIQSIYLSDIGLLAFIFFQTTMLARKFATSFVDSENYARDYHLLSLSLEEKIRIRTLELETEKDNLLLAKKNIEVLAESRKKLSLIGQMAAGIVHDIKNPMATIKALAEMANSDQISKKIRMRNLSMIVREMDRLNDLAYEILDFSKGEIKLNLEEVNLKNFILELEQFLSIDFNYANIKLILDLQYEGNICIDKDRVRRVIVNLAKNAIEAMHDGEKEYNFIIRSENHTSSNLPNSQKLKNDMLQISLIDNGPGLPQTIEERIFEAFSTEGKVNGTGLGLFMSKLIVEAHRGELTYKTKRAEGTTFIINLPIQNKDIS